MNRGTHNAHWRRYINAIEHMLQTPIADDEFPEVKHRYQAAAQRFKRIPTTPTIVCLCGSTKFKEEFLAMQKQLTKEGKIVLSVGWFSHADDVKPTPEEKLKLDELHKRKIDLSDEIFVINKGGYIGSSTESEIIYASVHGKTITYMEPF